MGAELRSELSRTGPCTVRYGRFEAKRHGWYVVVLLRHGTGTGLAWKVLSGTVLYGFEQYTMEDISVVFRLVFLIACWVGLLFVSLLLGVYFGC